jgi:hypothetical protein
LTATDLVKKVALNVGCVPALKSLHGMTGFVPRTLAIGSRALLACLAAAAFSLGCRTVCEPPPVDLSESGWQMRQGQAVWRAGRNDTEVAGELLVATHTDGRALVEFTKPPVSLMTAYSGPAGWQVRFAHGQSYRAGRGDASRQPCWLQLPRALRSETLPAAWSYSRSDGSWRLENKETGEVLAGYFSP